MPNSESDQEQPAKLEEVPDDNSELHPLFWDSIPANAAEHVEWQALQAMDAEQSPLERAEGLKASCRSARPTAAAADTTANRHDGAATSVHA